MTISRSFANPSFGYSRGSWRGSSGWCYAGFPVVTTTQDTRLEAASLRQQARARVAQGDVNLGESLPEVGKTARMISNRLSRIGDIAEAVVLGDLAGIHDLTGRVPDRIKSISRVPKSKRLANGFLELQYGWGPLVGDIYGGLQELRDGLRDRGDTVTGGASLGPPRRDKRRRSTSIGSPDELGSASAHAVSRGVVSNPAIRELQELGLLNPALIAWNALPYSFVLDWALPLSDILGGLTADLGLSSLWTSVSTEVRHDSFYVVGAGRVWSGTSQTVYRQAYSESIWNYAPTLRKLVAPHQSVVLSAVALLRQRFN